MLLWLLALPWQLAFAGAGDQLVIAGAGHEAIALVSPGLVLSKALAEAQALAEHLAWAVASDLGHSRPLSEACAGVDEHAELLTEDDEPMDVVQDNIQPTAGKP